jgi:saccharopine dehydrogenase (NAD+, L-lysine-forming)
MKDLKLGLIKETKTPPDRRVPLTPKQCKLLLDQYNNVEIFVQPSDVRAYNDAAYVENGAILQEDLSNCDVLMGVKEVEMEALIPEKTYFFFSHTIKEQPYNRDLLRKVLNDNIQLIDYEVITNAKGRRLIGFGRYAGIVGCYNAFLAFGKKHGLYDLKPANLCDDRKEMEAELAKITLPDNFKVVLTGWGRVGGGAREVVEAIGNINEVSAEAFKTETFDGPVYTQLNVTEYNERNDGASFERGDFYNDPTDYQSTFSDYSKVANMYVSCHYWDSRSPFIYTRDDLKSADWNISVVADISADIDGPVASTLRPSTIDNALYGYDPQSEQEVDFMAEGAVGVMAIDNLPCELPKDASEDFGNELIKNVIPFLLGDDPDRIIARATLTNSEGALTEEFAHLQNYVDGVEVAN